MNGVAKDEKSLQTDYVPQVYSSSNDENLVQQLHQSQLENRILQEKLVNEQRKVAILQVEFFSRLENFFSFRILRSGFTRSNRRTDR